MCRRTWSSRISAIRLFTPPRIAASSIRMSARSSPFSDGALHGGDLPAQTLDAGKQFLFRFRNFREFVLHDFFAIPRIFSFTCTLGGYDIKDSAGKSLSLARLQARRRNTSSGSEPAERCAGLLV